MQITNKKHIKKAVLAVVAFIICLIMAFPVYILAKTSLSSPAEVLTQHPTFFIKNLDLSHWIQVFNSGNLWPPLTRSLIVSTATTFISLFIAVPACYSVSRFGKKVKYGFILGLFFTRMIPSVAIALPISVTFLKWGLLDSVVGLILANLIGQLPFMAWILVSTFESVPFDLEEAAAIDGASRIKTLIKVVLPVSMQGIAVSALYVWLNAWNEFTYALYLSNNSKTMPLQIYYYVDRGGFFEQAAYSAILAVPVIIITFILQRYLKSDYLSGAIKG